MASGYKLNRAGIRQVTTAPDGPVVRDLRKRANRVQRAAKRDVGVASGTLRASINVSYVSRPVPIFRVGSKVKYALVHHEGSRPHLIRAKRRGRRLRITSAIGLTQYRRSVNHPGTKGRKYLSRNLWLAIR